MIEPLLKYPLRTFLYLSTGHLKQEDRAFLDSHEASTENGWFIWAPGEYPTPSRYPDNLKAILVKAREMGSEYVLFDGDAEPLEGLPYYDEEGELI